MEPEIHTNFLDKILPATISLIVTGLASIVIGIYLEKFRNKLTILKYSISFQPLATSTQNDYWGDIEVYHNNRQINHLSFVTIKLENDTNIDLQNLNVDTWCDSDSQFLAQSGVYDQGRNAILLEQNYYNYFTDVLHRNQLDIEQRNQNPEHLTPQQLTNEINWIMTNKKFHLPVLNRHSSITINLLVENFKGLTPQVTVNILHKSLKLIKSVDKDTELKKTLGYVLSFGLIIFIAGFIGLLKLYPLSTIPIVLSGILGVLNSLIGFGLYHLMKFIKRLLA